MTPSETPGPDDGELTEISGSFEPVAVTLPLFPLSSVLFPQMPVLLHIFEERYKQMINRCLKDSAPFGIVLIQDGHEAGGAAAVTYDIGCTARIAAVERLPDGRMNIEVVGEERFRILDTHDALAYRVGFTEPLCDAPADAAQVIPLADQVLGLLRDFLTRSLALAGKQIERLELPDEPERLSYLAAGMLPITNEAKQALLEATDTALRLEAERDVLQEELVRLRRLAETSADLVWEKITSPTRFADYRSDN